MPPTSIVGDFSGCSSVCAESSAWNREVTGSNPVTQTKFQNWCGARSNPMCMDAQVPRAHGCARAACRPDQMIAGIAQREERNVANVKAMSASLITRSKRYVGSEMASVA